MVARAVVWVMCLCMAVCPLAAGSGGASAPPGSQTTTAAPPPQAPSKAAPIQAPTTEQPPSSEKTTESYENAFVKMLLTLLLLAVLVFFTIWMLRRLSQGKFRMMRGDAIKILEKKPLSQKSMLYLIEVKGKQMVIAESQLEIRPLTTLEEPPIS